MNQQENGRGWLDGIAGSNPAGGMDVCFVNFVWGEVEASATVRSLVQRSPTECVTERDKVQQ